MKSRIAFIAVLQCFIFTLPVCTQETRIRIAVMDLVARSGFEQGEAYQITELFKNELINNTRFSVIDFSALSEEDQDRFSQCVEVNCAIEIGQLLDTDYVIIGSIGELNGKAVVNYTLVNTVSEEKIFAEELITEKSKLIEGLPTIATKISNAAVLITKVDLSDIRDYIRREQYAKAKRYLSFYIEENGEGSETNELMNFINNELAKEKYRKSQELLENCLFDDAQTFIEAAIALDPVNPLYPAHRDKIEEEARKKQNMTDSQLLDEVERFLHVKNYRGANTLLRIYKNQTDLRSTRAIELETKVQKGIAADEKFETAKRSLSKRDFEDSRAAINEALQLVPGDEEYENFVIELEAEEARYKKSMNTWQKYKHDVRNIDYLGLFVLTKDISNFLQVEYAGTILTYREKKTMEKYRYGFSGITLEYMYHIFEPFSFNIDFLKINFSVFGSISFGYSRNETVGSMESGYNDVVYNTILQENLLYADLHGGAALTTQLFAYTLGIGGEISNGLLNIDRLYEITLFEGKRIDKKLYYMFGVGLDIWVGWNPTENIQVMFSSRFTHPWMIGIEHTYDKQSLVELSIGVGFSLF